MLSYKHSKDGQGLKIYISGKITGLDFQEVLNKFQNAEDYLLMTFPHAEIINPTKLHPKEYQDIHSWDWFMIEDIKALLPCCTIALMECWKNSKGAKIEHEISIVMDKKIIYLHELI